MSTIPGFQLEDYVAWELNVVVDDRNDPNISLQMAEMLGNISPRRRLSAESFDKLIATYFEEYRQPVEYLLNEFDDSTQSWRDYAGAAFGFIGDSVWTRALIAIKQQQKGE